MIELALLGTFCGLLFQEHKWRQDEWSSWHPALRAIGLWAGYNIEYLDIIYITGELAVRYPIYWLDMLITSGWALSFGYFGCICFNHIDNPHIKPCWCYLYSAAWNWITIKLCNYNQITSNLMVWIKSEDKNITQQLQESTNVNWAIVLILGISIWDKDTFLEENIIITEQLIWISIGLLWINWLIIMQLNFWVHRARSTAEAADIWPAIKVHKGLTAYNKHYLKWAAFIDEPLPWKFFHFMRLNTLYELKATDRSWQILHWDQPVYTHKYDNTRCYAVNTTLDNCVWPHLKAEINRMSYHSKVRCQQVYNTLY